MCVCVCVHVRSHAKFLFQWSLSEQWECAINKNSNNNKLWSHVNCLTEMCGTDCGYSYTFYCISTKKKEKKETMTSIYMPICIFHNFFQRPSREYDTDLYKRDIMLRCDKGHTVYNFIPFIVIQKDIQNEWLIRLSFELAYTSC